MNKIHTKIILSFGNLPQTLNNFHEKIKVVPYPNMIYGTDPHS